MAKGIFFFNILILCVCVLILVAVAPLLSKVDQEYLK